MVPSMDLLKALFSFCLERLNWLKQIPDILMPLCQSKLQSNIAVFISCIIGSAIQIWSSFCLLYTEFSVAMTPVSHDMVLK